MLERMLYLRRWPVTGFPLWEVDDGPAPALDIVVPIHLH